MIPISNSERKKIIEARERGESYENIVKWFKVSISTIFNILRKYKETGFYEAKEFPGKQSSFTDEMNSKIIAKIKETPDITQQGLIDELKLSISQPGLSKHLKKRLSMQRDYKKKRLLEEEKNLKKNKKV